MLRFELGYQMRRPATHIFSFLLFMLGFLALGTDAVSFGGGGGPMVKANSPFVLAQMSLVMSIIGLILLPGVTGTSVIRDIEFKTHEMMFSTPISKWAYAGGRFFGSFLVSLLIYSAFIPGALAGSIIGPALGWINPDKMGAINPMAYIQPFFVFTLPNAFFFSAISFGMGLIFRNFIAVYVQGFALFILWQISQNFTREIENRAVAALLDPLGFRAYGLLTQFWTPIERNTLLVGFTGEVLLNRIIWVGIALLIFGITYKLFRMTALERSSGKVKKQQQDEVQIKTAMAGTTFISKALPDFSSATAIRQFISLCSMYLRIIVRERAFLAIALIGLMNFGINAYYANRSENTDLYPVTYLLNDVIRNTFSLYALIIATLYAGELIWKERSLKLGQTFDALPLPAWAVLAARLSALVLALTLLNILFVAGGIFTQIAQGFMGIELGQYVLQLAMISIPLFVQLSMLAMCVHTLVNQKYVGHMVVILIYIFQIAAGSLGLEHTMWGYGSQEFGIYSDMNGWTPFLQRGFSYMFFYLSIAALLAWISTIFTVRGAEDQWKQRLRALKQRLSIPSISFASISAIGILGMGGFILYNTNSIHQNFSKKETENRTVNYEKNYQRYKWMNQPKVVDLFINCEIHPYERWYTMSGRQILKNIGVSAIDTLFVNYDQSLHINRMNPSRAGKIIVDDTLNGIRMWRLQQPLQPGDSMIMDFSMGYYKPGFPNSGFNTSIIHNGTFLYTSGVPSYGYNSDAEMSDPSDRRKYGLGRKARIPSINDDKYKFQNYISNDAHLMRFEAIVSTAPDQIAIAPGYLQKEWQQQTQWGERRFFHYKMDKPIWNFVAILSGRYQVHKDIWTSPQGEKVNIEIYHDPAHPYNAQRFAESAKLGLDYYSRNFSAYQHKQYRIIEFPRYSSFAQAFPNTIPFSEGLQFIARPEEGDENIDFGFFVNAHELAHQWWAHQVLGSNQQGCTLLSESLAEYSALRVMEKKYGRQMAQKFLRYELDGYLRGRAGEPIAEQPIAYNENQQYIHYNKGSHTFYCLADYIGENTLNTALAEFIREWGGKYNPYPNSRDLLKVLRKHTPDSLQEMVTDLFERITIFSNQVQNTSARKNPDGTYTVDLEISTKKFHADSIGNEKSVGLNDWIDIGVFAESSKKGMLGRELYFQKHKITGPSTKISVIVKEKPVKAGIDPYYKLVDREPDDNVKSLNL